MKTVLVTGANRGIGLALVGQLAAEGARVIATCRTPSQALKGLDVEVVEGIELTNPEGCEVLARAVDGRPIDTLIHNAGTFTYLTLDDYDVDNALYQYQVNAVAPLLVTRALLPCLQPGARIAILTSRLGSLTRNTTGEDYGYRMSKAAANMAGRSLAVDLRPRSIAVALIHPGVVRTDMTEYDGDYEPDESAAGILSILSGLTLENTWRFWHVDGSLMPW